MNWEIGYCRSAAKPGSRSNAKEQTPRRVFKQDTIDVHDTTVRMVSRLAGLLGLGTKGSHSRATPGWSSAHFQVGQHPVRPRERLMIVVENHSRQKELTELAELRIERLQLKFRLLYSEKQEFFYQAEHQRLDEMCDVFVDQIHVARRAEEKAEADAAARSTEARSLSEQLTAAQSALATAEESAARSTALAQRHLEALRTLPILPQSALSEARQQIGAGGCGTIAVQGLSLAFKRPQVTGNPIMDDVYYKTFVAEAALMAELRHPNLVQCVAAIHDDAGRLAAYGMPRGQHDLWDELQSYGGARPFGPSPVPRVKTVGLAVISALRYLFFTAGITHHDVKLGNVLAMKDGTIKVADFGLAARISNDGCSADLGAYRGTPGELVHPFSILSKWCPEPHDDLWGLAMMLAEMITGRPLAVEQCRKLDQLIADYNSGRDKAGLENLDLECCAYGILCPTRDQRLAALQAQWDIQIRPQPNIPCELLDGLHQILRLSDDPQIASSAASAAAALDMLEAALHKIPDPVKNPGLGRQLPAPPLQLPPQLLPTLILPGLFPMPADGRAGGGVAAGVAGAAAAPRETGTGHPAERPADSARFLHGAAEQHPLVLQLHIAQQPQQQRPQQQRPLRPEPRLIFAC